uniref:Uncharacterized protein n=1 Tax=viral metagenome TaxID=1070528 RepID=A0A6C0KYB6_9ZZZZ|tara:strand:- start:13180 stop:13548 length:369 start_codon:yes stop_codon:yes gene_type:complete
MNCFNCFKKEDLEDLEDLKKRNEILENELKILRNKFRGVDKALMLENKILKEKLENSEKEWVNHIDVFVEKWYEENKDNIDIGVVNLGFFEVDILPDYIEKHLYKKVLKILYSYLTTTLAPS